MRELLAKVVAGQRLTETEAAAAMAQIMEGSASAVQIGALLTALRTRGEAVDEIVGFARIMRQKAVRVQAQRIPLVDTCGTGGDALDTFNISTAAALVAAAAGAAIAKHGNRAATSKFGSADVLETLGVRLDLGPESVGRCIDTVGIGFLFARSHHPAMKHAGPVRAELGFRTIFNALGPLTNPAGATRQVIGVYDSALCEPLAHVLRALGAEHALVVHGCAGLDEIATFGETIVAAVRDGEVSVGRLTAEAFGVPETTPEALAPGVDAAQNAALLTDILDGERGPRRDIVLVNAAAALFVAGVAPSLRDGVRIAAAALDAGAARQKLADLAEFTQHEAQRA